MTDKARIETDAAVNPDPETLGRAMAGVFPAMDSDEQIIALTLYRLLAAGEPVPPARVALQAGLPVDLVNAVLKDWPGVFLNADQCVIGFWGLSLQETAHRLELDGKTFYGWCAWDTLFIPELLGNTAQITSACPVTGKEIRLVVSPAGIDMVNPEQVVVSFLVPEEREFQENITASFCHFVYYFADRIVAEQWSATHPGTFVLSLADAFRVGQLLNATRYNQTLNQ